LCRYTYFKTKANGLQVTFIDLEVGSAWAMNICERTVEDYIINVLEMSKDQELILWPFLKE
jgi:hypothetical protein